MKIRGEIGIFFLMKKVKLFAGFQYKNCEEKNLLKKEKRRQLRKLKCF
jgi:hypothetical protein